MQLDLSKCMKIVEKINKHRKKTYQAEKDDNI